MTIWWWSGANWLRYLCGDGVALGFDRVVVAVAGDEVVVEVGNAVGYRLDVRLRGEDGSAEVVGALHLQAIQKHAGWLLGSYLEVLGSNH